MAKKKIDKKKALTTLLFYTLLILATGIIIGAIITI